MVLFESPQNGIDKSIFTKIFEVFKGTKSALDVLKEEIDGSFFGKALSWIKKIFGSEEKTANVSHKSKELAPNIVRDQVEESLKEACNYYGLTSKAIIPMMLAFADFESGFRIKVQNSESGALGLFQFVSSTDRHYRPLLPADKFSASERNPANREGAADARVSTWMGLKLMIDNAKSLGINLNNINTKESAADAIVKLYIAHNSGPGNVRAILQAQKGDTSLLEEKTKGDHEHWLWKRVRTTKAILPKFYQYWDKYAA